MRRSVLERVTVLVTGLILLAAGLGVLELRFDVLGRRSGTDDAVDTGPVRDVLDAGWWPWAAGGAAVLLGLLGLVLLLRRLPRRGAARRRLAASGPTGRLELDLGSLAGAVADHLAHEADLARASGSACTRRGRTVLEIRVDTGPEPDLTALGAAVAQAAHDLTTAFPDDDVSLRVLAGAPRPPRAPGQARGRRRRRDAVRVT